MIRRISAVALALALLASALPAGATAAVEAPLPTSMAAVGDSITQAASSAGSLGSDAPQNSWSTGTSATVNSHYLRLLAAGAAISGRNYNRSVSGAKVADLNAQMQNAAALQPGYLTVLIGGNDVCTDTVAQMTSVADFQARFQAAMTTLTSASPATRVYVVSIPDVYQLWNLFKNNFWARFIWSAAGICQSLLANPTSTQQADVQRRATVRQRTIDFNAQLATVCAQFDACLFDGNAVFNSTFTTADVSGDYFHPSVAGQTKLAAVSWSAGFEWIASPPPPPPNQAPTAAFATSCAALTCTFTDGSTDDGGAPSLARSWTFGDGASSSATSPTHTFSAAGTYPVTLTVTDVGGLADTESQSVSVSAAPPATMVVRSLSTSAVNTGKNTWTATATIVVTTPGGAAVANATVSSGWSVGAPDSCTTSAAGSCSVTSDSLNRRHVDRVSLSVGGVTHATLVFDPANSQTSVTVARPT